MLPVIKKERSEAHQAVFNMFLQPDPHSHAVYKMLTDTYASFSKKVFSNPAMFRILMSGYNPEEILDYPICGKCETPAAWNGYHTYKNGQRVRKCTCIDEKCGHTTYNPVTLRVWIKDEFRKKAPPEYVEELAAASDIAATRMVMQAANILNTAIRKSAPEKNRQMGIDSDTQEIPISEPKADISVEVGSIDHINLKDYIKQQEEDLENA